MTLWYQIWLVPFLHRRNNARGHLDLAGHSGQVCKKTNSHQKLEQSQDSNSYLAVRPYCLTCAEAATEVTAGGEVSLEGQLGDMSDTLERLLVK